MIAMAIIYMTYRPKPDTESATGRHSVIEITPEMIAAGASALAAFNPDYASPAEGAERIIRSALSAGGIVMENAR
jgi:hypothetical protein